VQKKHCLLSSFRQALTATFSGGASSNVTEIIDG